MDKYSFLDGDSLWAAPDFGAIAAPCAGDTPGSATVSGDCASFLAVSDRARVQWQLESESATFEQLSSFQVRN